MPRWLQAFGKDCRPRTEEKVWGQSPELAVLGAGSGTPDIRLGVESGCCQPTTEMRKMSVGQGEMSLLVGFSAPPLPPQVTDRHAWRRGFMAYDQVRQFCFLLSPSV